MNEKTQKRSLLSGIKKAFGIQGKTQSQVSHFDQFLGYGPSAMRNPAIREKGMVILSDFMTVLDLIAHNFAQIEFTYNELVIDKNGTQFYKRIIDSNLDYLLNRVPNSEQTPFQFKKTIIYNLFLKKRFAAYIHKIKGIPVELIPIEVNRLEIERKDSGELAYFLNLQNGNKAKIPNDEILYMAWNHVSGFTDIGFNTVHQIILQLLKNLDIVDGNITTNVQSFTGIIKVPENSNPVQRKEIFDSFQSLMDQSRESGSGVLVLDPKWDYEELKNIDKRDRVVSDEFRKDVLRRLSRAFHVPLAKLAYPELASSAYKSTEELNLEFLKEAVLPFAEMFKDLLIKTFTDNFKRSFNFTLTNLIKHDIKTLSEVSSKNIVSGIMTPNEVRSQFWHLPAIENGDYLLVNSATQPLGLIIEQMKKNIKNNVQPKTQPQNNKEKGDENE